MYSVHATKKLLDRVKAPATEAVAEPSTVLCNWYATAIFWKPQAAIFVNEITFLPVFLPLAPASTLVQRFPAALSEILEQLGVSTNFIDREIMSMRDARIAKTSNRSTVGVMNEFVYYGGFRRDYFGPNDFVQLSLDMAEMPVGPLHDGPGFPDRAVKELVDNYHAGILPKPPPVKVELTAPTDIDIYKIRQWCSSRVPRKFASQWKTAMSLKGKTVTILDQRADYRGGPEWSSQPIAQIRFSGSTLKWTLFWADPYDHWHRYPYLRPGTIDQVLSAIDNEPGGFFGN